MGVEPGDRGEPVVGATAPGPLASPQRRLVATAVAVGLVGLVLGWVVGRAGSDGSVVDATPSTSSVARTTTTLLGGDTLPEVATTTVVRSTLPRPTTTVAPVQTVSDVDVSPVLQSGGRGYRLVGFDSGGRMLELDTATGQLTTTRVPGGSSYDPASVMIGPDWVLVPDPSGGSMRLLRDGQTEPDRVELGDPWSLVWIPDTELFWKAAGFDERGAITRFEQVDLEGRATGPALDIPAGAWAWWPDPAGGLVTSLYGRTYALDDGQVSVVGAGDLIALSSSAAVLRDCDAKLRCGLVLVDRTSGGRTPVGGSLAVTAKRTFESVLNWGPSRPRATFSPDGEYCTVVEFGAGGASVLSLLEVATGETVELATETYPPMVEWSPDGRFAFYLDDGRPMFWDRTSGETEAVSSDPSFHFWQSIAMRPGGAPVEG